MPTEKQYFNQIIFKRFEEVRNFFFLSKKDFCSEIEITQDMYNKYKNGDRSFSLETLNKCSKKFLISISFLIGNIDDIEESFILYEYNRTVKEEKVEHISFMKKHILLAKIKPLLKGMFSEKKIWEKLLFNPKEEALRALALVLLDNKETQENAKNAKNTLKKIILNYYSNMSFLEKIPTNILTNEQKYLLDFVNSLSESECLLFLENMSIVIDEIKKNIKSPYSKVALYLKQKGYKKR
jgi:transcriptional regulator with XRE-family HTH domain